MPIFKVLSYVFISLLFATTSARSEEIIQLDIADAVDALSLEISKSREESARRLSRIDPNIEEAISKIQSVDGFRYGGFSARTQVETLYRLAEAQEVGEGRRFIAKASSVFASESAALATDPDLIELSRSFSDADLVAPLRFAEPTSQVANVLTQPITPKVARAIDLIAEASDGALKFHSALEVARRNLNLGEPPKDRLALQRAVEANSSSKEIIGELFRVSSPPPTVDTAAQNMLLDMAKESAALELDPRLSQALDELGARPLPENLTSLSNAEPKLTSARTQAQALVRNSTSVTPSSGGVAADVLAALAQGGIEGLQGAFNPATSRRSGSYEGNLTRHSRYSQSALVTRGTSSGGGTVPRAYRTAIRSPRAARGVAVGAEVTGPWRSPKSLTWVESKENSEFGYFIVSTRSWFFGMGQDVFFVSQPLYSDSAAAAISTLLGEHGTEAEFREGEIAILMSMVPKDESVAEKALEETLADYEADWPSEVLYLKLLFSGNETRATTLAASGAVNEEVLDRVVKDFQSRQRQLPNGIVVHPATAGYQLAWAAARTDFWFGNSKQLMDEISMFRDISEDESQLSDRFPKNAGTWQFFERDSKIKITEPTNAEALGRLSVVSSSDTAGRGRSNNHFSVTLFGLSEERPTPDSEYVEDRTWRLVEQERVVEPLLDWLFTTHPDFIRVNHYSEALSIMRWATEAEVTLVTIDALGVPTNVRPPDVVYVGGRGLDISP